MGSRLRQELLPASPVFATSFAPCAVLREGKHQRGCVVKAALPSEDKTSCLTLVRCRLLDVFGDSEYDSQSSSLCHERKEHTGPVLPPKGPGID